MFHSMVSRINEKSNLEPSTYWLPCRRHEWTIMLPSQGPTTDRKWETRPRNRGFPCTLRTTKVSKFKEVNISELPAPAPQLFYFCWFCHRKEALRGSAARHPPHGRNSTSPPECAPYQAGGCCWVVGGRRQRGNAVLTLQELLPEQRDRQTGDQPCRAGGEVLPERHEGIGGCSWVLLRKGNPTCSGCAQSRPQSSVHRTRNVSPD